jgi:hypothetical protein
VSTAVRSAPTRTSAGVADSLGWICLPPLAVLLVFLPRITGGGFTSDDWSNRSLAEHHGPLDQLSEFWGSPLQHRVLHLPYTSLYSNAFGDHAWLYILWGIVTAGLLGVAVALLLRRVGVPTWIASVIGALGVIFPYSSITKIWITAHVGHTSTLLALIGIGLGIRALSRPSMRAFAAYRAAAMLAFLLSLDLYEIALPVVCASGVAYWLVARRDDLPMRRVALSWGLDLLLVAVWYLAIRDDTIVGGASSGSLPARLGDIAIDGGRVLAGAFVPFLAPEQRPDGAPLYSGAHFSAGAAVLAVVLVLAVAAVSLWVGMRGPGPRSAARWGAGIIIALAAGYAGWLALVPAADFYRPVPASAAANRINVLAAFGMAGVVVCTVGALATLVAAAWRRAPRAFVPVAVGLALLLVAGAYARHIGSEINVWNQASQAQQRTLAGVRAAYGPEGPPPHTRVFLTDNQEFIADGAEVFFNSWGFPAALRLEFDDFSLTGAPHRAAAWYRCSEAGMVPYYLQFKYKQGTQAFTPYGRLDFVSWQQPRVWHVTDRASCVAAVSEAHLTLVPPSKKTPPTGET